jgi:tetratricopeptide (TPR) repeat protein
MGELLNLTVYNPSTTKDDDFLRSFVARRDTADRLIKWLEHVAASDSVQHQLIIGQRGMGKTSMLRRLALATTTQPNLSEKLLPLSFREEQYNVHNLYVFWANCLDALADFFDRSGQSAKAERLDREVAALQGAEGESLALFEKWVEFEKKRPLLLLDNIDLIFGGLKKDLSTLRIFMEKPGGIVIVGGAATRVEAIADANGPFHDLFEITQLNRLTKDELITCLRSLAVARGGEGEKVSRLIDKDSARIRTLHDLTGGNPRTLTLLYMLLELDSSGDVFSDLERLLDQVTVLYKARVEDLAPQGRVVLDAVALAWNPVLASAVATLTHLDVTIVSSQLDRLQKEGVIEKVAVSKTPKGAYQISERFFNIWYLMRHGPRRQRSRLRWLSVFLKSFYTDAQLVERAKSLVNTAGDFGVDTGQFLLALSEAIDDEGWRSVLKNHARDEFEKYAASLGRSLDEIVDPADVPRPETAAEWVRYGNLLRQHLRRAKEAESAYLSAIKQQPNNYPAWFNLGSVRLADLADPRGAVEALTHATEVNPKDLPSHYFLGNALQAAGDPEHAKDLYRTCLQLNRRFYLAAIALGDLLTEEGNLAEAEYQYRYAGSVAPKTDTEGLHASAFFVGYIVEHFDRSIRLYKRLLNIKPDDFVARSNLAVLEYFNSQAQLPLAIDDDLIEQHSASGQNLIRALHAMRVGERGRAIAHVGAIFDGNEDGIFETYRGFLLLMFREAARQRWGDLLLRLLDETGASDRHWPLRAGYEAYLFGEERLLDVNPEVRTAAEKILRLLNGPTTYRQGVERIKPKRIASIA